MRLVDAHKIRCERDDFDTFKDYMTALQNIKNAKTEIEPIIRCRDCIYHKDKRCTIWRERAVIVECYTADDGYCYLGKEKGNE